MSQTLHKRHHSSPAPKMETIDEFDAPCLPSTSSGAHFKGWFVLGHLFTGPVFDVLQDTDNEPSRILDVATGTGIWAIEMAELFPHTEVIGLDTVPIQHQMAPVNCDFDIDTLTHTLPYAPSSFNLIHFRFASHRLPHFPSLLRSAWTCLRPNGLLLIFDHSGPASTASGDVPLGVQAWEDAFKRGCKGAGWEGWGLKKLLGEKWVREGKVEGSEVSVPIGSHGVGRMAQLRNIHLINTRAYIDSARYMMIEHGGYTDAEVDVLSKAYMHDVETEELYSRYHTISIRKQAA
ncbi:hypothetical protein IAT38_002113 [Cryptococcus sp. DSM 104549]